MRYETKLNELTNMELERANKLHPPFVDRHQAYAVIKEEIEEAVEEIKDVENYLKMYWNAIREDDYEEADKKVKELRNYAKQAISELIQVTAMCKKAQRIGKYEALANRSGDNENM